MTASRGPEMSQGLPPHYPPPGAHHPPPPAPLLPPPPLVPHSLPTAGETRPITRRSVHPIPEGRKSFVATLLLALFLGLFGVDRLYLGKYRSGVVKLMTFGGLGHWWLIDIILTLVGHQRDTWGLRLDGYDRYKKKVWFVIGSFFGATMLVGVFSTVFLSSFDESGLTPFGWSLLGTLGLAVISFAAVWVARKRRGRAAPAVDEGVLEALPSRIRARADALADLRRDYLLRAAAGVDSADAVVGKLDNLVLGLAELFQRVMARSGKVQQRRAEREYGNALDALVDTLGGDYLLDIMDNPLLWHEPELRMADVLMAVDALADQIVDNIRQVNAGRNLSFQALREVRDLLRASRLQHWPLKSQGWSALKFTQRLAGR